jgi:outer membrane protein W
MRISVLAAFLLAVPLFAQQTKNEFAVSYGRANFSEDVGDTSSESTIGLTYNRFWTPAVSTRFGVTEIGADLEIDLATDQTISTSAWTASVEYHLLRDSRISPWAGVGVAYVQTEIGTREFDASPPHELTGLVTAGADVNLIRLLSIGADVAYMPYKPDVGPIGEVNVSPLTISANVKFRW